MESLVAQWEAILANPLAFVSCAGVCFAAGFAFGKLFYGTQTEIAKERLESARDNLALLEKEKASQFQELSHTKAEVAALRSDIDRAPVTSRPTSVGDTAVLTKSPTQLDRLSPVVVPSGDLFLRPPSATLQDALAKAKQSQRAIFLVIYDAEHPTRSKLAFTLGYFLEYQTTRKLVDEYFEAAVAPVSSLPDKALVPPEDPLEKPRWVVLAPDGRVIRSEGLYANPDVGLERTREVIANAAQLCEG